MRSHRRSSSPARASTTAPTSARAPEAAEIAEEGFAASPSAYPFLDAIQASFGAHDLSDITAHAGPDAGEAASALGANAFAMGSDVAFADTPDLHTAAHEAAHVVQQRRGVSLSAGKGQAGDVYERHADAVADAVVAGESAEALLDAAPGGGSGGGVQCDEAAQPSGGAPPRAGDDGFDERALAGSATAGTTSLARAEHEGTSGTGPMAHDDRASANPSGRTSSGPEEGFPKEWQTTYRTPPWYFVPPAPLYLQGSLTAALWVGWEGAPTSTDLGVEGFVGAKGTIGGNLDLGLGASSGIFAVGGNVSADAEVKAGAEAKWTSQNGLENALGVSGKVEGGFNAFVEILGWRHEVPLTGIELAKLDMTITYANGDFRAADPWGLRWTFQPREGDIFPANEFCAWLRADDEVADRLRGVRQAEIDALPESVRAGMLATLNEIWMAYSHEELALKLLGIYEEGPQELSDTAWNVLEAAFVQAHGRPAEGFEELHTWLTGAGGLSSDQAGRFDDAASTRDGQREHLVDIQLQGHLSTQGGRTTVSGLQPVRSGWFGTGTEGVTTELDDDDRAAIEELLRGKRYGQLVTGVALSTGTRIRASIHVDFLGPHDRSLDWRNGRWTVHGVQDGDAAFTAFLVADLYL